MTSTKHFHYLDVSSYMEAVDCARDAILQKTFEIDHIVGIVNNYVRKNISNQL